MRVIPCLKQGGELKIKEPEQALLWRGSDQRPWLVRRCTPFWKEGAAAEGPGGGGRCSEQVSHSRSGAQRCQSVRLLPSHGPCTSPTQDGAQKCIFVRSSFVYFYKFSLDLEVEPSPSSH